MRKLKSVIRRGRGKGVGEEEREAKSRKRKLYTSSIWNQSILELEVYCGDKQVPLGLVR